MSLRRVMPDLTASDPQAASAFYVDVLGMRVAMDLGWVLTLVDPDDPARQLSLISQDASGPVNPDVSVEVSGVEEVEAAYRSCQQRGDEIVHPLTDEPWGVRRFFVRDPSGAVINIVAHR